MFIKLNKLIHVSEYTIKKPLIDYGVRIKYSIVSSEYNTVLSLIPERFRDKFYISAMEITGLIIPHTDSGILSTINIYIKPDNCITKFYDLPKDTERLKTAKLENQTNGRLFDSTQLIFNDSFVAQQDEAWLLDVSKPHSVSSNKEGIFPPINRKAIVIQSTCYTYEQVKEMLIETGYL